MDKPFVEIFTDGSCSGNPGAGGWGAILKYNLTEKVLSGGDCETTNNRMELTAAISALEALKRPCRVRLYSDSKYLVDSMNLGWAEKWKRNGWKKKDKSPALNPELFDKLLTLFSVHEVELVWVKGHAGHPENERCDRLAVAETEKHKTKG